MRLDNTEWFEAMRRYVSLSGLCVQEPGVAARRINKLNERIAKLEAERAELVDVIRDLKAVMNESEGVAGWHRNSAVADWREFEFYDAVVRILARHKEQA